MSSTQVMDTYRTPDAIQEDLYGPTFMLPSSNQLRYEFRLFGIPENLSNDVACDIGGQQARGPGCVNTLIYWSSVQEQPWSVDEQFELVTSMLYALGHQMPEESLEKAEEHLVREYNHALRIQAIQNSISANTTLN